jgi:hypothetical protein
VLKSLIKETSTWGQNRMTYKMIFKKMKKTSSIVLFLLFIICIPLFFNTVSVFASDNKITFIWAFGALKNIDGTVELVNIDRDITLKKDDQIKMLIQLKSDCYVYIIHQGSKGELSLLYPEIPGQFNIGVKVYIPQADYWFTLDDEKGKELFYLLASKEALTSLEDLFEKYKSVDVKDNKDISAQILAEIKRIKRKNRKPLQASAEKPASIGGSFRGVEKQKTDHLLIRHSIKISTTDFYSKTFTIVHE